MFVEGPPWNIFVMGGYFLYGKWPNLFPIFTKSHWLSCYRTQLADKSRCMVRLVCLLDFSSFPLKFHQLIKNRYKRSSAECQTKPSETIHASRLHLHRAGELLSREGLTGLLNWRKWKLGKGLQSIKSGKLFLFFFPHCFLCQAFYVEYGIYGFFNNGHR